MSCKVCGKEADAHRLMAHVYSPDSDTLVVRQLPKITRVSAADSVLRAALIRMRIVTREQLEDVEKELRAAGLLGGSDVGDRGSSSRDIADREQEKS